jgi:hypothetical protein
VFYLRESDFSLVIHEALQIGLLPSERFLLLHERQHEGYLGFVYRIDFPVDLQIDPAFLDEGLYLLLISIEGGWLVQP